ncbi:MAG: dihydrofolate reductase [Gemmatimonadetes bacterium]|nr:dihydrofolate reductase [Gemmatimonadota bacterium]
MRRIVYSVASSLDGFIAGPNGEYDWIPHDPDIDFAALGARFDTLLMGRKTYQPMAGASGGGPFDEMKVVVASRTLRQDEHPRITIIPELTAQHCRDLKAGPGKDIWLFGGGDLFRSLLELGEVDEVRIAIVPVLLGGGVPLLGPLAQRAKLTLKSHRLYPKSGIVSLDYGVKA